METLRTKLIQAKTKLSEGRTELEKLSEDLEWVVTIMYWNGVALVRGGSSHQIRPLANGRFIPDPYKELLFISMPVWMPNPPLMLTCGQGNKD